MSSISDKNLVGRSLKILHVTVRSDRGGGPKHILNLLVGFKNKHFNFVAAPTDGHYFESFCINSKCVFSIPSRMFSFWSFINLISFVKKNEIDLIHSHGRGAGIYSRLIGLVTGMPVVHTHHGIYLEKYRGLMKHCMVLVECILNSITTRIVFVSKSEVMACSELGAFNNRKSVLIPNGVSLAFDNIRPKRLDSIVRLIAVTRLEPEKGNLELIDIMYDLSCHTKDFILTVVGEGRERELIQKKIFDYKLEDQIMLVGGRDDVPQLLKNSDIYISASHGEAHSIAMLEAMSHALPVIASRVRGHIDMINHRENGLLFDLNAPKLAALDILELINDAEFSARLGQTGKQHVVYNFSLDIMLKRINFLYQEIVHENRNYS